MGSLPVRVFDMTGGPLFWDACCQELVQRYPQWLVQALRLPFSRAFALQTGPAGEPPDETACLLE
jgi:hypothetical protein